MRPRETSPNDALNDQVIGGSGCADANPEVVDAIVAAIHDAQRDCGIIGRLVPSIDREADPAEAVAMVEWVIAARAGICRPIGRRQALRICTNCAGAWSIIATRWS